MKKVSLYILFICLCILSVWGIPTILSYIHVNLDFISLFQFTWLSFLFLFSLTAWAWFVFHIGFYCLQKYTQCTQTKCIVYILTFAFVYTALCAYALDKEKEREEKENRIAIADKLAKNEDEQTEIRFKTIQKQILQDTFLRKEIRALPTDSTRMQKEEQLNTYLKQKYFSSYFNAYNFQFTYCKATEKLAILASHTIYNCQDYFSQKVADLGSASTCPNLYRMRYGIEYLSYLAKFEFPLTANTFCNLYIEMGCEAIIKDPGYFDLLYEKESPILRIDNTYSYSLYRNGELLIHQGDFLYPLKIDIKGKVGQFAFSDWDEYNHYVRFLDDNKTLVISKAHLPKISTLYTFSFLLLWFSVVGFVIYLFGYRKRPLGTWRFAQKLQFTVLGILFSVLVFLCILSIVYIKKMNNIKDETSLREKTLSSLLDLEKKYMDYPAYPNKESVPDSILYLWQQDLKSLSILLSNDIHLYDAQGHLMLSTQKRLFDQKVLSDTLNPKVYTILKEKKSNLYIQREQIDGISFLSAYTSFRNAKNVVFGYLNLPYFVKQSEWDKDVGTYISSYISIYVFLIFLVLLITIFWSNRLIRPLNLIAQHVADIELGKKNSHLAWHTKDEIGELISQYNSLVDELEESARLLAQSERQSAWTEMAKQVAHEIKNPLTPMKLQVQHLERAYMDHKPDFEERLHKFSALLLEQIDRLSDIATTFSQYAQWSKPTIQKVSLQTCIAKAIQLFEDKNIHFELNFAPTDIFVNIDEKQFSQVLLNVLKNAVQSIAQKKEQSSDFLAQIQIQITPLDLSFIQRHQLNESLISSNYIAIEIEDNGIGITNETLAHLFEPNFTTKSSGSGLGLAISKRIMEGMNGGIVLNKAEFGVNVGIWVEA
ncbi:MAG: ATP-binding protein [Bacteroidales bacterium]